ncbi:MAG: GNAT family N-acetyltransferase [Pseudomonadales bacterium]
MARIWIRDFDSADQKRAAELINSGLGQRFGVRDDSRNPDLYDIGAFYGEDCFLVALDGDELIGTGALIYESQLVVRIVRMHTAESRRRQGVGTALIAELEERAQAHGAREVFLETDIDWEDAHAFYHACGYVEFRRNELGIRFHKLLAV